MTNSHPNAKTIFGGSPSNDFGKLIPPSFFHEISPQFSWFYQFLWYFKICSFSLLFNDQLCLRPFWPFAVWLSWSWAKSMARPQQRLVTCCAWLRRCWWVWVGTCWGNTWEPSHRTLSWWRWRFDAFGEVDLWKSCDYGWPQNFGPLWMMRYGVMDFCWGSWEVLLRWANGVGIPVRLLGWYSMAPIKGRNDKWQIKIMTKLWLIGPTLSLRWFPTSSVWIDISWEDGIWTSQRCFFSLVIQPHQVGTPHSPHPRVCRDRNCDSNVQLG